MSSYFFYDAHCTMCARFSSYLKDLAPGLECVAGAAEESEQPEAVRGNIAEYAVYLGPEGSFAFGHRAIGEALANHGRNSALRWVGRVLLICALAPLWGGIYALVARNRHRIGAAFGFPACAID